MYMCFHCNTFTVYVLPQQMDSRLHTDSLSKVLDIATQGCKRVHTILDTVVKKNLETSFAV